MNKILTLSALTVLFSLFLGAMESNVQDGLAQEVEKRIKEFNETKDLSVFDKSYNGVLLICEVMRKGRSELLKKLLDCGVSPTKQNNCILLIQAVGKPEIVQLLLAYKADPNVADDLFGTPLPFYFFQRFSLPAIDLLLKHGADPNILSGDLTGIALISAVKEIKLKAYVREVDIIKDYIKAIKLLLYYGANPYLKNNEGESALDVAKEYQLNDMVDLFEHAQERLIKKLHALLSRGDTPFPSEVAMNIAQQRYNYSKQN